MDFSTNSNQEMKILSNENENIQKDDEFLEDLLKLKKQLIKLNPCSLNEKTIALFSVTITLLNRLYETILTRIPSQRQTKKLNIEKDIPEDFEPNIFNACEKGKLSSVEYLIDVAGFKANQYNENPDQIILFQNTGLPSSQWRLFPYWA